MIRERFIITPKKCIDWILYGCIVFSALYSLFGVSLSTFYFCDLLNVLLLYFVIKGNKSSRAKTEETKRLLNIFILLLMSLSIGAVINLVSPLLVMWGIRNLCRYFVLFFGIIAYYGLDDIKRIMRFYFATQIFNLFVGIYKYFYLGLFSDAFGGGIFWGGGGLNPFCLLILLYYLNLYVRKQTSLMKLLFAVISAVVLGAMAEEKMMIMLAAICVLLSVFINQYADNSLTHRRLAIWGGIIAGVFVAYNVINYIAPNIFDILLDGESLMDYATVSFDEGYRIPRVGAFQVINKLFLDNRIKQLFGLGIGNCDTSSFSFLQSDFYNRYGSYNYRWFTHQWTYLECGIIGFGIFIIFFVFLFYLLMKKVKKCGKQYQPYLIVSTVYSIVMIFLMWHSSAIRIDTAYLIYFGLAIGIVALKENERDCGDESDVQD